MMNKLEVNYVDDIESISVYMYMYRKLKINKIKCRI